MSIFSKLFRRQGKTESSASTNQRTDTGLPCISDRARTWYLPLQVQEVLALCDKEVRQLLELMPLEECESDRLLRPVIEAVARECHLLPASETHHHKDFGGLVRHSLECAAQAVRLYEMKPAQTARTMRMAYIEKPLWQLAAAVMGLVHDIGKVEDVVVKDAAGLAWNPEVEALSEWLARCGVDRYSIEWKPERVHKAHEVVSLRLAHRRVIPVATIKHLAATDNVDMMNAIDAAIVLGQGPFAEILRDAEGASIQLDLKRHRAMSASTDQKPPAVQAILATMHSLIRDGQWEINKPGAEVLVGDLGTFWRADSSTAAQLRSMAVADGRTEVPADLDAQIQSLADAGIVRLRTGEERTWSIQCEDAPAAARYVMLTSPETIFQHGDTPEPIELRLAQAQDRTEGGTSSTDSPERKGPAASIRANAFKAPPLFEGRSEPSESGTAMLDDAELMTSRDRPMTDSECQDFVTRLIHTCEHQMTEGQGALVEELHRSGDGLVCSSLALETVLSRHQIALSVFQVLLRMKKGRNCRLAFIAKDHQLILLRE